MPSPNRAILIIGSGPGIGVSVASHFVSPSPSPAFTHVALLARSASRLQDDAKTVLHANPDARVRTYTADISQTADFQSVLKQVVKAFGEENAALEVVVYNATRVHESVFGVQKEEDILADLKVSVIGLYTSAHTLLPSLADLSASSSSKPTFFITGGMIAKQPSPPHFALSVCKAAQYNLAQTLRALYQGKGVHIANVLVGGVVGPGKGVYDPKNIAGEYGRLWAEGRDGRFEVEIVE